MNGQPASDDEIERCAARFIRDGSISGYGDWFEVNGERLRIEIERQRAGGKLRHELPPCRWCGGTGREQI